MMSRRLPLISLFVVLVLSLATMAAKKKSKKIEKLITVPTLQFGIVYGDKITAFNVFPAQGGGRVEYSNSHGAKGTEKLSATDYEFLKSKVAALKGPSNKQEFCPTTYMVVKGEGVHLLGCLGAPNKLAQDLQSTVNLLSLLF